MELFCDLLILTKFFFFFWQDLKFISWNNLPVQEAQLSEVKILDSNANVNMIQLTDVDKAPADPMVQGHPMMVKGAPDIQSTIFMFVPCINDD